MNFWHCFWQVSGTFFSGTASILFVPHLLHETAKQLQAHVMYRVGQSHIYTVYIQYYLQGNYRIYGHIQTVYYGAYSRFWPNILISHCSLGYHLGSWRSLASLHDICNSCRTWCSIRIWKAFRSFSKLMHRSRVKGCQHEYLLSASYHCASIKYLYPSA